MSQNTKVTLIVFVFCFILGGGVPENLLFDLDFRIKCSLEKKVNTVVTSTTQTNPQNVTYSLFVNAYSIHVLN